MPVAEKKSGICMRGATCEEAVEDQATARATHVLGVAMVKVHGHVTILTLFSFARHLSEAIPDGCRLTVSIPSSLDLISRDTAAVLEVLWQLSAIKLERASAGCKESCQGEDGNHLHGELGAIVSSG